MMANYTKETIHGKMREWLVSVVRAYVISSKRGWFLRLPSTSRQSSSPQMDGREFNDEFWL
jgi:hypothetical protein